MIGLIVVIVSATYSYISWAEGQAEEAEAKVLQQQAVATAVQQLMHNEMYQTSRRDRKKDEIREDKRELGNILEEVGNDEPSPRQARSIKKIDNNIKLLEQDIENIEVELNTSND